MSDPFPPPVFGRQPSQATLVQTLARQHTVQAVQRLALALNDDDPRVAVTAASVLLDRGWGKPQPPRVDDTDNPVSYVIRGPAPSASTEEWLRIHAPKQIDADPNGRS